MPSEILVDHLEKHIIYDILRKKTEENTLSWDIELYATESGEEPVMTFLNSLPGKHRAKAISISFRLGTNSCSFMVL